MGKNVRLISRCSSCSPSAGSTSGWRCSRIWNGRWETDEPTGLTKRKRGANPLRSELIRHAIKGGLPAPIYEAFRRNPLLVRQAAHFPPSINEDILSAVGLDLASETKRSRIADFRHEVLESYGHACAF